MFHFSRERRILEKMNRYFYMKVGSIENGYVRDRLCMAIIFFRQTEMYERHNIIYTRMAVFKERRMRNIETCEYQESMATEQMDGQIDEQPHRCQKKLSACVAILHMRHKK